MAPRSGRIEDGVNEESVGPGSTVTLEVKLVEGDEGEAHLPHQTVDFVELGEVLVELNEIDLHENQVDAVVGDEVAGAFDDFEVEALGIGLEDIDMADGLLAAVVVERDDGHLQALLDLSPAVATGLEEGTHDVVDVLDEVEGAGFGTYAAIVEGEIPDTGGVHLQFGEGSRAWLEGVDKAVREGAAEAEDGLADVGADIDEDGRGRPGEMLHVQVGVLTALAAGHALQVVAQRGKDPLDSKPNVQRITPGVCGSSGLRVL